MSNQTKNDAAIQHRLFTSYSTNLTTPDLTLHNPVTQAAAEPQETPLKVSYFIKLIS